MAAHELLLSSIAHREGGRYKEAVRELQRLSDRDLADIGIMRCDIHEVAFEASYGR